MTGIRDSAEYLYDLPEHRYFKSKKPAEKYRIIQVGLCFFTNNTPTNTNNTHIHNNNTIIINNHHNDNHNNINNNINNDNINNINNDNDI